MRPLKICLAAWLIGLSLSSAAEARTAELFVLVLDEMAASTIMDARQQIDAKNFPNLARLARSGSFYPNHTTVADFTYASVPSIIYGQRPAVGEHTDNYQYDDRHSLFKLLGGRYHKTIFQEVNPVCKTCPSPPSSGRLAGARLDKTRSSQQHLRKVAGAIKSIGYRRKPNLWLVHAMLPHVPWRFLPNGEQYDELPLETPGMVIFSWDNQQYPIDFNQQRMILQSRFADRVVGLMMRKIKQAGLYQRSMIIVTADHGGDFQAGRHRRSVTEARFSQTANVPMIVKYPGQTKPTVNPVTSNHTHILPTINAYTLKRKSYQAETLDQAGQSQILKVRNALEAGNNYGSLSQMLEQRSQAIAERERSFETRGFPARKAASHQIGQTLRSGKRAEAQIKLDNPQAVYKPRRGYRQVLISATPQGLKLGEEVTVTINDKVAGSGQVFNYWPAPQDIFKEPKYQKRLAVMLNPRLMPRKNPKLGFYRQTSQGPEEIKIER